MNESLESENLFTQTMQEAYRSKQYPERSANDSIQYGNLMNRQRASPRGSGFKPNHHNQNGG